MQENGQHHVARIDETVNSANLHERAEAIAVPDFDYVQQGIDAVISAVVHGGHREHSAPKTPKTSKPPKTPRGDAGR